MENSSIPGGPESAIVEYTTYQVETATVGDHRITVLQLTQGVKIGIGPVGKIIHDHLHKQKLSAQWITRLFPRSQKQERVNCSKALSAMNHKNKDYS